MFSVKTVKLLGFKCLGHEKKRRVNLTGKVLNFET